MHKTHTIRTYQNIFAVKLLLLVHYVNKYLYIVQLTLVGTFHGLV